MGLFSGGNSSKTTENKYDNRANQATSGGIAGNGNTVVTNTMATDFGAVDGAFDFGGDAIDAVAKSQVSSFDFAEGSMDRVLDSFDDASRKAFSFAGDAFNAAIDESAAARSESFKVVSDQNERLDKVYQVSGRESSDQALKIVMLMAGLVGAALIVGVARA